MGKNTSWFFRKSCFFSFLAICFIIGISSLYSQGKKNDLESIITFLSEQIKNEPDNYFYYSARGTAYYKMGFLEKALDDLNVATNLDSENWELFFNKGVVLYDLKRYEQAIDAYTKSASFNESADVFNNRGLTYIRLEKYFLAIQDFTTAISIGEPEPRHFYNRGYAKLLNDLLEEAIPDLEKSIALDENTIYGYYYLSLLYEKLNSDEKAKYNLNKAIENGLQVDNNN